MNDKVNEEEFQELKKVIQTTTIENRLSLDDFICKEPECTCNNEFVILMQHCHEGAGFQVYYDKRRGALVCVCNECHFALAYRLATDG